MMQEDTVLDPESTSKRLHDLKVWCTWDDQFVCIMFVWLVFLLFFLFGFYDGILTEWTLDVTAVCIGGSYFNGIPRFQFLAWLPFRKSFLGCARKGRIVGSRLHCSWYILHTVPHIIVQYMFWNQQTYSYIGHLSMCVCALAFATVPTLNIAN